MTGVMRKIKELKKYRSL